MVGWHRVKKHEFEQTLGDSEGQGSLACCSPCPGKLILAPFYRTINLLMKKEKLGGPW